MRVTGCTPGQSRTMVSFQEDAVSNNALLAKNWSNLLEEACERREADPGGVGRTAFRANTVWKGPKTLVDRDGPIPIYFRTGAGMGGFVNYEATLVAVHLANSELETASKALTDYALPSTSGEAWENLKTVYVVERTQRVIPFDIKGLIRDTGEPINGPGMFPYAVVQPATLIPAGTIFPDEISPGAVGSEGARITVQVNRFERSAALREACIEHHGVRCVVCDLSFEERYGEIGRGFIHVHHLVPLSQIAGKTEVNAVTDLVPVCPNCHAMLHRGGCDPASLRQLLR